MPDSGELGQAARAVYRAMSTHVEWQVRETSSYLGMAPAEVTACLEELAQFGLVLPAADGGGMRAVHPTVALTSMVARAEAEIEIQRRQVTAAQIALAALAGGAYASDTATRLPDVEAVRDRLRQLSEAATSECLSLNPNPSQTPEAKAASRPLNQRMLERGVAVCGIYQDTFANHPGLAAYARWLHRLGGQTRTVPIVPLKLVIYDRRTALLPLDPEDSAKGALETTEPGVVTLACALFDTLWAVATPFGEPVRPTPTGLEPLQQNLLGLLADGHTDDAAARTLGISVSTVRRNMATLMSRLGARSRFQAGVLADRLGWLGPPGPTETDEPALPEPTRARPVRVRRAVRRPSGTPEPDAAQSGAA